jgi:hypothetical protein
MWFKKKQIALLATIGVMIVILVPALYLYLLVKAPLSFKELDFDDNGIVTFSELIHANLNCYRVTLNGQVICKEVVFLIHINFPIADDQNSQTNFGLGQQRSLALNN